MPVVLVTGISRGIGIAWTVAERLTSYGWTVAGTGWPSHDHEQPWGGDPRSDQAAGMTPSATGSARMSPKASSTLTASTFAPIEAPAMPMPLLPVAAATPATKVPWPTVSVTSARLGPGAAYLFQLELVTSCSVLVQDGIMAYLKPPALSTKVFNKLVMHSTLGDVHTLEVGRRNAVEPQRIPVIPVEHEGSLFVVSTRGESDWVKNARAAGTVRLGQKGNFETYAVTEVPAAERAAVLAAYRKKAGREVNGYWKRLPGDADHPTFMLTPI